MVLPGQESNPQLPSLRADALKLKLCDLTWHKYMWLNDCSWYCVRSNVQNSLYCIQVLDK